MYKVLFTPRADRQIDDIYDYITHRAGANTAIQYIERLTGFCYTLRESPHRGTLHHDVRRNLRVIGFEDAVSIQFVVVRRDVQILNISYHGQNYWKYFRRM